MLFLDLDGKTLIAFQILPLCRHSELEQLNKMVDGLMMIAWEEIDTNTGEFLVDEVESAHRSDGVAVNSITPLCHTCTKRQD